jgi:PPM family protein phosphatase
MMSSQSSDGPAVFGAAIQGVRDEQEDSFRILNVGFAGAAGLEMLPDEVLLVLADGMGGHTSGRIASRIAIDGFADSFVKYRAKENAIGVALRGALTEANGALAQAQRDQPELEGMGTTIVGACVASNSLHWISVGDSPLWLYRGHALNRLNDDHSLRSLAEDLPGTAGNMLQSCLNGRPIPLVDFPAEPLALHGDDLILLASDGILTLSEAQIATTIRGSSTRDPELLAWLLLHAVQDRRKPRQDNCTAIVLSVPRRTDRPSTYLRWLGLASALSKSS